MFAFHATRHLVLQSETAIIFGGAIWANPVNYGWLDNPHTGEFELLVFHWLVFRLRSRAATIARAWATVSLRRDLEPPIAPHPLKSTTV
jgi:hypothetical protein